MMKNPYPNLPGQFLDLKDGGMSLKVDKNPPSTKSMLLLGTATDGPVGVPVAVDPITVQIFGSSVDKNGIDNGATLPKAFETAYETGCRDIRLMRITGKEATAEIKGKAVENVEEKTSNETLGVAEGNEVTTIVLEHTSVLADTLVVKVSGVTIPKSSYTFTQETSTLVIKENVADAGKSITLAYTYMSVMDNNGVLELQLNADTSELFSTLPADILIDQAYTISKDGTALVKDTDYTVDVATKKVVFVYADATELDTISIVYKREVEADTAINSIGGKELKTATGSVTFTLNFDPIVETLVVFANKQEMLNKKAYTVTGKTLTLHKEYFAMNAVLETSYAYNLVETVTPYIKLMSGFAGASYDECKYELVDIKNTADEVIGKKLIITKPESKKAQIAEKPMEFSSLEYPNFKLLVSAINNHSLNNGLIIASTIFDSILTKELNATLAPINFEGGEDGVNVNKRELFEALSGKRNAEGLLEVLGAYQLLENYNVDNICIPYIYADDELPGGKSFAYELALFCAVLTFRGMPTSAFISCKPCKDTSLLGIRNYISHLKGLKLDYFMLDNQNNKIKDNDGNFIDLGRYISVDAGPEFEMYTRNSGVFYADNAIVSAAEESILKPQSSRLNKSITGTRGLKFNISNQQADDLVANRINCYIAKTDRQNNVRYVAVEDLTAAQRGSDYSDKVSVKVVREIGYNITEVCDPYLGEDNSIENQNAMSSAIDKRLGQLKEAGTVLGYTFQIIVSEMDRLLGSAQIEYDVVCPRTLKKINHVLRLKA